MLAVLLPALLPLLTKVFEAAIPDPNAREKAMGDLLQRLASSDLAQMDVNKAEAANPNVFVSGWRPFIGWVCGCALAYQYLAVPLITYVGFLIGHPVPAMPKLDDQLWQLLLGMLGIAGLRTYEKLKGVA